LALGKSHGRLPCSRMACTAYCQSRLFALTQDSSRMKIEHFSRFRRRYAAFCTNQQLLIKLTFQSSNLLAQRRLGDMQYFSGLRQATNIDNFHEIFQSSEVHFASCPECQSNAGVNVRKELQDACQFQISRKTYLTRY